MLSCFWGDILGQEIPNLHDPYTVLLYCMLVLPYYMIIKCCWICIHACIQSDRAAIFTLIYQVTEFKYYISCSTETTTHSSIKMLDCWLNIIAHVDKYKSNIVYLW